MKRAPLVLALSLVALAAAASEPAGSTPAPAKSAAPASKPEAAGPAKKSKVAGGAAAPARQVTLQGDLTCAKCGLHEASACQNVLVVKEDGQDVKYYLAKNAVAAAEHEKVCGRSVPATVTGTVSDEGGHKVVTAATVTTREAPGGAARMPGHE